MKTFNLYIWLFTLPIFISAQQTHSESNILQTFDNIIGLENTKLYNGKRYYNIYKATKENHNFFSASNFITGNVNYDGASFYNVNLKYDTFTGELIFKPNGDKAFINIELIQDKVLEFNFANHYFVNSNAIKENKDLVSGYLEVIYKTPTLTLYAKRKKLVTERIRSTKLVYLFSNEPSFYLAHNGILSEIKSSKSFKKIFPDYSKAIKTKIKDNKEQFDKDDEGLLLFLTQWIDFKLQTKSAN